MTNDTTTALDQQIEECLDGYIVCLVWVGLDWDNQIDGNPVPLDENYSAEDVTEEARALMREDVAGFITANYEDCLAYVDACRAGDRIGYYEGDGSPWAWIGHDIALTRNGHGAGFWDRGLGDLGERLTAMCRPMGEQDLWPNAEGQLEVEG